MTRKELELVQAYQKYIHFLGEAYNDVLTLAWIHGYRCSEQEIEFGQQLRNTIKELEEECKLPSDLYEKEIVDRINCGQ